MERSELIAFIRATCARELNADPWFDFFWVDYEAGEQPDDALVRLFYAEKEAQRAADVYTGDEGVILALCHG